MRACVVLVLCCFDPVAGQIAVALACLEKMYLLTTCQVDRTCTWYAHKLELISSSSAYKLGSIQICFTLSTGASISTGTCMLCYAVLVHPSAAADGIAIPTMAAQQSGSLLGCCFEARWQCGVC